MPTIERSKTMISKTTQPSNEIPIVGSTTQSATVKYPDPNHYVLRLFVSCRHSSTEASLRNLHHALERSVLQPYTLQVVDISKHPEQAELDQVTATPTLLRVHPLPHRRLVGKLENEDQLLHLLAEIDLDSYH
jgi:circadian clock protein KaiB